MTRLEDAHFLVVGATGGLGSAIARRLVAAGGRVTLTGRSKAALDALGAELGDRVVATAVVDLTAPDGPATAVRTSIEAGASLEGVVYAAGVVAFGPAAELDDDDLDELVLVNLLAPIRLARAAVPHLASTAVIVNLSAVVAEKPTAGMAAYSATKAALTAFDRALATELRRSGVRVLDVRPPHTRTGLADRPIAGAAPRLGTGTDPADVAARIVAAIEDDESELATAAFD